MKPVFEPLSSETTMWRQIHSRFSEFCLESEELEPLLADEYQDAQCRLAAWDRLEEAE